MAHQDLLLRRVVISQEVCPGVFRSMKFFSFFISLTVFGTGCSNVPSHQSADVSTQNSKPVGGPCDGCELIYEGMPDAIGWIDTLPDWHEEGQRMEVNGTVYKADGKTAAANVILYFYHTDSKGYYSAAPSQIHGRRNGHIRGWIKTNFKGEYKIYTNKPAPYPGANIPAHIHVVVKEPAINEYYIDEYEFKDDPLLTHEQELRREKRGGSGIVKLSKNADGLLTCRRDIFLGLNIPDYREGNIREH